MKKLLVLTLLLSITIAISGCGQQKSSSSETCPITTGSVACSTTK